MRAARSAWERQGLVMSCPAITAIWGVCLHARAGAILASKLGTVGFLARELLREIPGILDAAG